MKKIPSHKEFLKILKKENFTVSHKKHYKITHPENPGKLVVYASSPSDLNAVRVAMRDIRREFGVVLW